MVLVVNYFLILSLILEIVLIVVLLIQKSKETFISTFTYLNVLLGLDILATLVFFNSPSHDIALMAARGRFVIECFLPAALFHMNKSFSFARNLPQFNIRNIMVFLVASLLASGGITNIMVQDIQVSPEGNRILFRAGYWIFLIYLNILFYLIFIDLFTKYRISRRQEEVAGLKIIALFLFPSLFLSFFFLYQLPYFKLYSPVIFVIYFLLAVVSLLSALKFQLLERDELVSQAIPHFGTISLLLIVFSGAEPSILLFPRLYVTILVFLSILFLTQTAGRYFLHSLENLRSGDSRQLAHKIEEFSTEIIGFIDKPALWKYVSQFCKEAFSFTKIAIITTQYDVSPYQIEYTDEFSSEELYKLISSRQSPLLEEVESERKIVNKFDYRPDSLIYQAMDRMRIYVCIPLLRKQEPIGMLLLGGNRQNKRITEQQLHWLKLVSSQISIVLENIRTIQQTVQTQKMAELGTLASQLAHDFQSFITIVKLENAENDRLRQHALYMEKLVQDLLNYARPQELRFSPVNINHLLDMSLDLIDIPANILVEKHYADNLPEINVDMSQMRRVFTNLIENSLNAMQNNKNGGRLKISTRPLRPISKVQRNPWIYIEILDDGEGIPEEFLDRIFEPFFTTNKESGGSGMGLAIVRQIITRHRGYIDVTSKPGKGTIFNIRLPYII